MIIAEGKPIKELLEMTAPVRQAGERVLVVGCGTCVTVCYAGGEKEAGIVASLLRMANGLQGSAGEVDEATVKRQCEHEFLEELTEKIQEAGAVVSLACAAGISLLAEQFPRVKVFPGVNTLYIGAVAEQGVWDERCRGCGDCRLEAYAGVCLVANCPKAQFNAPCGLSRDGQCEANPDAPCAWETIARRLGEHGRHGEVNAWAETIFQPKDWSKSSSGGKRITRNERMRLRHDDPHKV